MISGRVKTLYFVVIIIFFVSDIHFWFNEFNKFNNLIQLLSIFFIYFTYFFICKKIQITNIFNSLSFLIVSLLDYDIIFPHSFYFILFILFYFIYFILFYFIPFILFCFILFYFILFCFILLCYITFYLLILYTYFYFYKYSTNCIFFNSFQFCYL